MTNIGTANYGDLIRRTLSTECGRNKKSCRETDEAGFDRTMSEADKTSSTPDMTSEKIKAPARWTSASLYKIDHDTPEGYTVNKAALQRSGSSLQPRESTQTRAPLPMRSPTNRWIGWVRGMTWNSWAHAARRTRNMGILCWILLT